MVVDARRAPIDNGALLVENGRVTKVGKKGAVQAPAGAMRVPKPAAGMMTITFIFDFCFDCDKKYSNFVFSPKSRTAEPEGSLSPNLLWGRDCPYLWPTQRAFWQ